MVLTVWRSSHCSLKTLLIQLRSECVTLCIGELTRVCAYPPAFVLKSQNPLFHGDLLSRSLGPTIIVLERDNNGPDPWEGFVER